MDAYLAKREKVDSKLKQYEHGNNVEILVQAMQDAEFAYLDAYDAYDEAYDELAPGTQQTERDEAAEGQMDSEAHFIDQGAVL